MKKILLAFAFLGILTFITGCSSYSEEDIVKELKNKIDKADSYYIEGEMEILNNEDLYTYDIKVSYKKGDNYRVELTNKSNDHEQVILRNNDGVYVITPSLNKSFKFQSDWPYNNSQIYLLSSLTEDMTSDDKRVFEETDEGYIFTTKVNYPNNKNLVKQMIYMNKKLNITEVRVLDEDNNTQIKMVYNKIKFGKNFENDYFKLNSIVKITDIEEDNGINSENTNTNANNNDNLNRNNDTDSETNSNDNINNNTNTNNNTNNVDTNTSTNENNANNQNEEATNTEETATIEDVIYPMYLPTNTYLKEQEKVDTDNGQRLILTFTGDSPFTLVEETVKYSNKHEIIPTYGELEILADAIAVVNDNSVNWISNGIEYYVVSDVMETAEILQVARSISVLPVSK